MNTPKPYSDTLDYQGRALVYKCYLKSHSFSFRCKNHSSMKCPFLLSIPVNEENYTKDEYKCIGVAGAVQASLYGHSDRCSKDFNQQQMLSTQILPNKSTQIEDDFTEWRSDVQVLRNFIRQNLSAIPSSIETTMRAMKQDFSKKFIKDEKRKIMDEIFPKDAKIAFHPSNCRINGGKDNIDDNLFRFYGPIIVETKKNEPPNLQEYYIFTSRLMMYQLAKASQWFVDGHSTYLPQVIFNYLSL